MLIKILSEHLANAEKEQKVGVVAGVPLLGIDLLFSTYGLEAALTLLIPLGAAGLTYITPIIGVILALLSVLYFSYRQPHASVRQTIANYTE